MLVDHVYYTYYRCLWLLIVYATETHCCTCHRCLCLLIVYATDTHCCTCCRCSWLLIVYATDTHCCTCCRCLWLLIVYATDTYCCTCCRCLWLLIVYVTDTYCCTCCRCSWLLIVYAPDTHCCTCCRCSWLLIVYAPDTHCCTCCRCLWLLIVYATDTHCCTCCRCLWLLIVLGMAGWLVFTLYSLYTRYRSYPYITDIATNYQDSLPLPAITFCLRNSIQRSRLRRLPHSDVIENVLLSTNLDFQNETFRSILSRFTIQDVMEAGSFGKKEIIYGGVLNLRLFDADRYFTTFDSVFGGMPIRCFTFNTSDRYVL